MINMDSSPIEVMTSALQREVIQMSNDTLLRPSYEFASNEINQQIKQMYNVPDQNLLIPFQLTSRGLEGQSTVQPLTPFYKQGVVKMRRNPKKIATTFISKTGRLNAVRKYVENPTRRDRYFKPLYTISSVQMFNDEVFYIVADKVIERLERLLFISFNGY